MQITKAIENLKILEGGKGREADNSEVNVGIDQSTFDEYCDNTNQIRKPVFLLTEQEIEDFYSKEYFIPLMCDKLPDSIGFVLFQYELNTSATGNRGRAVKDLQILVNAPPDSVMGHETLKAVLAYPDPLRLALSLLSMQEAFYKRLYAKNPQLPLPGWEARISKTKKIIGVNI